MVKASIYRDPLLVEEKTAKTFNPMRVPGIYAPLRMQFRKRKAIESGKNESEKKII